MNMQQIADALCTINQYAHVLIGVASMIDNNFCFTEKFYESYRYSGNYIYCFQLIDKITDYYNVHFFLVENTQKYRKYVIESIETITILSEPNYIVDLSQKDKALQLIASNVSELRSLKESIIKLYGVLDSVDPTGTYALFYVGTYPVHAMISNLDLSADILQAIPRKDTVKNYDNNTYLEDIMRNRLLKMSRRNVTIADVQQAYDTLMEAMLSGMDVNPESGTGTGRAGEDKERGLTVM